MSKKRDLENDFENPSGLSPILTGSLYTLYSIAPTFSRFSHRFSEAPECQLARTSAHRSRLHALPSAPSAFSADGLGDFSLKIGKTINGEGWRYTGKRKKAGGVLRYAPIGTQEPR